MIVAVTGHRPNKLGGYRTPNPYYNSICTGLDQALVELMPRAVIVGMAQGVDQWMAKLCLWNGIPYIAAIPFEGFENGANWPEAAVVEYRRLLSQAVRVVPVCDPPYAPWKMQARNEWMVDHCNVLLAVFDGTPGGTANCVNYAQQVRRTVRRIDYLRPPPIVNRERPRPQQLVIEPEPVRVIPPRQVNEGLTPQQAAERTVARFLDAANQRPESEGQRVALRRAREAARAAERQEQIEVARREARARREEERRAMLQVTDVPSEESPPAPEPKEEKVEPVVRDFGRFVDLDV